jgi:hypothetical protein
MFTPVNTRGRTVRLMPQPTRVPVARYTVRVGDHEEQRIERARTALNVDGVTLSENAILTVLVRRGLDSLERELALSPLTEEPRKAA